MKQRTDAFRIQRFVNAFSDEPLMACEGLLVTTTSALIGALVVTGAAWGARNWLQAHLGVVLSTTLPTSGECWLLADGLTPKQ